MLTRRKILSLAPATLCLPTIMHPLSAAAAPLEYTLKPIKLSEGTWMIAGAQEVIDRKNGGAIANVSILDTSAGAVVIDTGPSHRYGDALAALAKELTGKPVVRVYNTHFHPDHVMGNQGFNASLIAAPKGVVDGLKILGNSFSDAMYQTAGDWMRGTEVVLPGTVLTTNVEDFGNRRIRTMEMRGHTACDLVLFDELSGIMFTGDLVFLDRAPTTPHAEIERWRINLANLGSIPFTKLVPGHGPAESSVRGIEQTRTWLEAIWQIIGDAFESGLDMTEAFAVQLPTWTEKIALARYEYERSVMHIYPQLESSRWKRTDYNE